MIALPLGLGHKLRRVPIVTIVISAIWFVVHVKEKASDRINADLLNVVVDSEIKSNSRDLFTEYCKSRKGSAKNCKDYSVMIWTGMPDRLPKGYNPSGDSKVDAEDMKEWIPLLKELAEEDDLAKDMRKRLDDCGEDRACFVYKDILWNYLSFATSEPQRFAKMKAYAPYSKALVTYRDGLKKICERERCLTRTNIDGQSLAMSQVRHGGWMHLISNTMIFVLLGIYAEQRTNLLTYLFVVVAGGTLGMWTHAEFFSTGDSIVIGGSANVSAVVGLFFAFFFKFRMKILLWLIVTAKVYRAPILYCLPLMFVVNDLVGGFDSGFDTLLSGRVAYWAHLAGFGFGCAAGLIVTKLKPLPSPFIYEEEYQDYRKMRVQPSIIKMISQSRRIIRENPDNYVVIRSAAMRFINWSKSADYHANVQAFAEGQTFLANNLQSLCAISVRNHEYGKIWQVLAEMPLWLQWPHYLGDLGQVNCLKLADFALHHGQIHLALRMYDFFLTRYPEARQARAVADTCRSLIQSLSHEKGNHTSWAAQYVMYHQETPVGQLVQHWLQGGSHAA